MIWLKSFFGTLGLLDSDSQKLSLTNLALIAVTVRVVCFPIGWTDAVIFGAVLVNYLHKRHTFIRTRDREQTLQRRLTSMNAALSAAQASIGELEKNQAPLLKAVEEMKTFINGQKLNTTFTRRQL